MVYEWEKHQRRCYQLYIVEKKSLEEIMELLRIEHNFTPSKRAFQTQFRRWEFPSKQHPAHKNDRLVARIKELWEMNQSQSDMLRILTEEGFDISQRELMRVRGRNRWLLRRPNPARSKNLEAGREASTGSVDKDTDESSEDDVNVDSARSNISARNREAPRSKDHIRPLVEEDRQSDVEKENSVSQSTARSESRKRRRRTKAATENTEDSAGLPRFPSETTVDEGRTTLSLDAEVYREIRTRFARICEASGVSKKTVAGPARWEAAKDQLVREVPHLQTAMWVSKDNMYHKKLALDIICTDVTKRMRTLRMTIGEAKNLLGTNPEESRVLRQEFVDILKGTSFTSKTQVGQEQWDDLKERWIAASDILQRLLAGGTADPSYADRIKAADVIAKDVMKRLRDDQTRRDHSKKEPTKQGKDRTTKSNTTSEPSSTAMRPTRPENISTPNKRSTTEDDPIMANDYLHFEQVPQLHPVQTPFGAHSRDGRVHQPNGLGSSQLLPSHPAHPQQQAMSHVQQNIGALPSGFSEASNLTHSPAHSQAPMLSSDVGMLDDSLPIDPQISTPLSVMLNPNTPDSVGPTPQGHTPYLSPSMQHSQPHAHAHPHTHPHNVGAPPFVPQLMTSHPSTPQPLPLPMPLPPVAIYLRRHRSSTYNATTPVWIAMLTSRSHEELRQVAVKDLPDAVCGLIEGKLEDMAINITRDDELTAFLAVVEGRRDTGGGSPTFYVQLLWKGQLHQS